MTMDKLASALNPNRIQIINMSYSENVTSLIGIQFNSGAKKCYVFLFFPLENNFLKYYVFHATGFCYLHIAKCNRS